MKIKFTAIIITVLALIMLSFTDNTASTKYKCMVQMTNYTGEGAYIVISLIDSDGNYEKTLYVQGDDSEWYNGLESWWHFYGKKRHNIDAITGETIAGGERQISVIEIEDSKINKGYSIRFETAVEDQEYYKKDIEFLLTSESVNGKTDGNGFIRYVRLMPN